MTAIMMVRVGLLGAGAALALWGPAVARTAQATPSRQCIDNGNATRWIAHDDHSILVRSNGRDFLVTTNACPRLAAPLTHVSVVAPGGTLICGPHDARLYVSAADGIRTPCVMQSIRPLSAAEARELQNARR